MPGLFIGLMAGTSADGLDAALVDLHANPPRTLAWRYTPYPDELRAAILDLAEGRNDQLDNVGRVDHQLGRFFAESVRALLASNATDPGSVSAIGSHGQTIRHRADLETPFTVQIADPSLIAELTGITTIADFRRRDMAAGGQGAPLVPGFHQHLFAAAEESRAVLNLGGMANLTLLAAQAPVRGFDTGPGNALLDAWHQRHRGGRFDPEGQWAAVGHVHQGLLERLMSHPFFDQPPPRSCGREQFNLAWLDRILADLDEMTAIDVQATLCELTVVSVALALHREMPDCQRVIACGGGVRNAHLMKRLQACLPALEVSSSADWGVDPDQIEAMAFAWLAERTLAGQPGNVHTVTGAAGPRVLGAIHPGDRAVRSGC